MEDTQKTTGEVSSTKNVMTEIDSRQIDAIVNGTFPIPEELVCP